MGYQQEMKLTDLLNESEKKLFSLSKDNIKKDFVHVKDLLLEAYERAEDTDENKETQRGIQTGFNALDNVLGGFQKSNLIIIAARPSVGKTALALDIARHVSIYEKKKVGVFSLEMSNMELMDRLVVMQTEMNLWDYRMNNIKDYEKLGDAMGVISEAELYIDDTPGQGMTEMRTKARRLKMEMGLDLIIIDYLQLIIGGNSDNEFKKFLKYPDLSRIWQGS